MVNKLVEETLKTIPYQSNPYFVELKEGKFEKEDFIETQIQFYFAVIFFSRPMAALAAKIPATDQRMEIMRNVWEEHGEGFLKKSHGSTFTTFLNRLGGITDKDIERRALWPEVRIFNTALVGACVLDEFVIGTALMGTIERMFVEISQWIGKSVVGRGWLTKDNMIHYNLHEELDIKHSQDFFTVLDPLLQEDASHRYFIHQGVWMGATLFNGLYEGLYKQRSRRMLTDPIKAHAR